MGKLIGVFRKKGRSSKKKETEEIKSGKSCVDCGKSYKTTMGLNRHIKKAHE